jgi:hypothetical protein
MLNPIAIAVAVGVMAGLTTPFTHAQDMGSVGNVSSPPSMHRAKLLSPIDLDIIIGGKKVGKTTLPAGREIDIESPKATNGKYKVIFSGSSQWVCQSLLNPLNPLNSINILNF